LPKVKSIRPTWILFPAWVTRQYESLSTLWFLRSHLRDFQALGKGKYRLLDLGETICMNDVDISLVQSYFDAKSRIQFSKVNGQVYANVRGFVFALPFPHGIVQLDQTFFSGYYDSFDIRNGVVLDVGAFIGDTAVYFAARGAKKVIAYEPAPSLFKFALENIKLNKLDPVVELRKEAVDNVDGQTTLYFDTRHPSKSSTYFATTGTATFNVKTVAFSSLMKEVGHVDLLKMNCEGAEHRILMQAYSQGLMKEISYIIVEIHDECKRLLEILQRSGFKIISKASIARNVMMVSAENRQHTGAGGQR
jgi:FkbM family methyltransferase